MSILAACLLACTAPPSDGDPPTEAPPVTDTDASAGPTAPTWEPLDAAAIAPLWGAMSVGPFAAGGVDPALDVVPDVLEASVADDALQVVSVGTLGENRFCGCAMLDPARQELVVLGGRDAAYQDAATAERVDLASGASAPLDAMGAAATPVGCWAAFSEAEDRGYVFGGAGGMSLSDDTWRYDPASERFDLLGIAGPTPRYDAAAVQLPDGGLLLVGGMDAAMDFARTDLWRFDPVAETWEELPVTSDSEPPGRRLPFAAVTPDGSQVIVGYGSDHPSGLTVRKDLWAYTLQTGAWEKLQVEGDKPMERGFAATWPGPDGSVGVLAFGVDGTLTSYEDAWVLWVP